jgi:non-specific serine/threonine protein kinase
MRNAIAWSYDLLPVEEQTHFRRLSVFVGGFSTEAAEAVCGSRPVSLDSLVAKSLVTRSEGDDGERFGMLETIREFGVAALAASGEEGPAREAHAAYVLTLAERAEPQLTGPEQRAWFERLDVEHDNLRAAMDWALDRGRSDVALRLSAALWRFWSARGYAGEGRIWLDRALRVPDAPLPLRAAALAAAGSLAEQQNDFARAAALNREALALWERLGDQRRIATTLATLGNAIQGLGDLDGAAGMHQRALELCRELGDRWGVARGLNNLGSVAYLQAAYDEAERHWSHALAVLREIGDARGQAQALNNLGAIAVQRGDLEQALERHEKSLALRRQLADPKGVASSLANLGEVAQQAGDLERAISLLDEACSLARKAEDRWLTAMVLVNLAYAWSERRETARAATAVRESLTLFRDLGDRFGLAGAMEVMATVLTATEGPGTAALLFAAASSLREEIGAVRESGAQAVYERDVSATRAALGDAAFAAAWETGRAMCVDDVILQAFAAVPT